MTQNRFIVYNASAGSGKTFKIATRYLNKIIQARDKFYIRHLIGITFTNKATEEMKKRIIDNLIAAAQGKLTGVMQQVALESKSVIMQQTGLSDDKAYHKEIVKRSRQRLIEILHYYDDFQLTTIDKMMFKIIKTFARDMQLSGDVEVVLDYKEVVSDLIDKLINQARKNTPLSRFLIDLAIAKVDDEKAWDIKDDLLKINRIIFDDNYFFEVKRLQTKSLSDFLALKNFLDKAINRIENQLRTYGRDLAKIIVGFEKNVKVSVLARDLRFAPSKAVVNATLRKQADSDTPVYYVKKHLTQMSTDRAVLLQGEINNRIHAVLPDIIDFVDNNSFNLKLYKALREEVNALSIQHELLAEIEQYKTENNRIFISDFNKLILERILQNLETDTPYIYMRLGEKYAHYFVDEFQDTSALQWYNLIPLIREALSKEFGNGETGTAMLVGDAKQSIYRFRGGKPEQFIALSNPEINEGEGNPFAALVDKKVENLAYNWRSLPQIINFNNRFFKGFTDYLKPPYRQVYQNPVQKIPEHQPHEAGYVQVRFLKNPDKKKEIEGENYVEVVYETLQKAEKAGYAKNEICILVNKHDDGRKIAAFLNEQQIEVISSESLLVINSYKVQFLLAWLRYLYSGAPVELFQVVIFLIQRDGLSKTKALHTVFGKELNNKSDLFKGFFELGYPIDYQLLLSANLYDALVYLIEIFKLNDAFETAYLQAFMEYVYGFSQQNSNRLKEFLEHWDRIAPNFSIAAPDKDDAVRIMTVHSAKGLEFPVVIYYSPDYVFDQKDHETKVWIPLDKKIFQGFDIFPVSLKTLENSDNPTYNKIYETVRNEKEFDNLNRLYVALTRASEQLYVILNEVKTGKYTGHNELFNKFLKPFQNTPEQLVYEFGKPVRTTQSVAKTKHTLSIDQLFYKYWQNNTDKQQILKVNTQTFERWQQDKKNAISYGMQLHDILSKIETRIQWAKNQEKFLALLETGQKEKVRNLINQILEHDDLKDYFSGKYKVLNEADILIPYDKGFVQKRPDRLLIEGNRMVIIDYKTGQPLSHHQNQLNRYAEILAHTGFEIGEKILVYIKDELSVVKV